MVKGTNWTKYKKYRERFDIEEEEEMKENNNKSMIKLDLHIHSKYSFDCLLPPERIIKIAEKKKLDGIAITDHDTAKGGLLAQSIKTDLMIIPGEEIKTEFGEVIGYFLSEEIKTKKFMEVVDAIKDQDGIICLPHPYRGKFRFNGNQIKDMKLIEVLNGRNNQEKNKRAMELAAKYNKRICAGSDAHLQIEIGSCFTILDSEKNIDSIKNELVKGDPKVEGHEIPGIISKGSIIFGKITKKMRR